tara:strand:- start:1671 stop:2138 length:468 start_codon:yes stop_codon:yes gene_type:complete
MFKIPIVQAHCDIPCKIYDPATAQIAALSVVRLMDIIAELTKCPDKNDTAQLTRLVTQKEAHAALVKHEVTTIWGDYFKQPQIEKFPDIHEVTHQVMQAASKCKQGIARKDGIILLEQLNCFAEMFWHSKDISTHHVVAPYPPALAVVHPYLKDA